MSWDGYMDTLKLPDPNGVLVVEEAAIWGIDPVGKWASTKGFDCITEAEIKVLLGCRTDFMSNGPCIAGVKCMLIGDKFDEAGVYSLNMKTKKNADGKAFPVCVGKTLKALIIAKGFETTAAGALTSKVYSTVEHLRNNQM